MWSLAYLKVWSHLGEAATVVTKAVVAAAVAVGYYRAGVAKAGYCRAAAEVAEMGR